ncbi:uncharacterized protein EDB93DRAFT_1100298 [Suillus bovinus]|uniref:uncharacterized protein n=1 Tax=Suillus bovinus TaxID=48563 RepID=UPI001B8649F7|nr:uncharacterized protein EDB93DRAFT_1100298 [Suillus bovinus]KAG2158645.1 hypothetical protein EDB93DRAFT_1100298 [Suillus bovinus]
MLEYLTGLLIHYLQAIKKYYGRKIDEEESDEEGAAKAREISAHRKEAAFYKKMLTDWDVAQRLFKQEMDEFNKAEQARKGISKNNLKKVLEDFSEQLCRTMGCHVVMLVSHKKQANQTLNVTLHESQPRNVKKSFSVSSDSIKEWTSTGFEFFAEWVKGEFYPTADQDKQEEEEHGLPELILDDEGYAQLPSCDGIRLKDQQELKFSQAVTWPTGLWPTYRDGGREVINLKVAWENWPAYVKPMLAMPPLNL